MNEDYSANSDSARFEFRMISPDDLVNVMAKFKKSKGFGVDGISSFFLKSQVSFLQVSNVEYLRALALVHSYFLYTLMTCRLPWTELRPQCMRMMRAFLTPRDLLLI